MSKDMNLNDAMEMVTKMVAAANIQGVRKTDLCSQPKGTGSRYYYFEIAFGINATLTVSTDIKGYVGASKNKARAEPKVSVNCGSSEKSVPRAVAFLDLYTKVVMLAATIEAALGEHDLYIDLKAD